MTETNPTNIGGFKSTFLRNQLANCAKNPIDFCKLIKSYNTTWVVLSPLSWVRVSLEAKYLHIQSAQLIHYIPLYLSTVWICISFWSCVARKLWCFRTSNIYLISLVSLDPSGEIDAIHWKGTNIRRLLHQTSSISWGCLSGAVGSVGLWCSARRICHGRGFESR